MPLGIPGTAIGVESLQIWGKEEACQYTCALQQTVVHGIGDDSYPYRDTSGMLNFSVTSLA